MAGYVSTQFRLHNAAEFIQSFAETDNIYFYIGKQTEWDDDAIPNDPIDTDAEKSVIWRDMLAMKKINANNIRHTIPRVNWTSGTSYVQFDDTDQQLLIKNFYVINGTYQVFKCLNNKTTLIGGVFTPSQSTIQPVYNPATPTTTVFNTADGYTWKYLYTMTTDDISSFLTTNWAPTYNTDNTLNLSTGIYSIPVIAVGSGYLSVPTISIIGDGTGATATAVISGGQLIRIDVTSPGTGYTWATVSVVGAATNTATARAIISPHGGHGNNPAKELYAYFVTLNSKLEYGESGVFPVFNDYRRIGLIKNPLTTSGTLASGTLYNMTYDLTCTGAGVLTQDELVSWSGGTARVISFDSPSAGQFVIQLGNVYGSQITTSTSITNGTYSFVVTTVNDSPDLAIGSGDIMYMENLSPIVRRSDQQEIFNIILEF